MVLWYSGLRRQLAIAGLVMGLGIDGWAIASAIFSDADASQRWLAFLEWHALASALAAPCLWLMLPDQLQRQAVPGIGLFFLFAFYVPLLGVLGLFGAVVVTAFHPHEPVPEWLRLVGAPDLPREVPSPSDSISRNVSGLMSALESAREPEVRMRALLATRQMERRDAVPLLRVALTDTVDEVRLMAYAMLDRIEKRLTEQIHDLQQELEERPVEEPHRHHYEIAESLWELAYLGLAQGEVLDHVLFNVRKHLRKALTDEDRHSHAWFLLGRVLLRQGDLDGAEDAFQKACRDGLSLSRVRPYLAEIAFERGRYADARELMDGIRKGGCQTEVLGARRTGW